MNFISRFFLNTFRSQSTPMSVQMDQVEQEEHQEQEEHKNQEEQEEQEKVEEVEKEVPAIEDENSSTAQQQDSEMSSSNEEASGSDSGEPTSSESEKPVQPEETPIAKTESKDGLPLGTTQFEDLKQKSKDDLGQRIIWIRTAFKFYDDDDAPPMDTDSIGRKVLSSGSTNKTGGGFENFFKAFKGPHTHSLVAKARALQEYHARTQTDMRHCKNIENYWFD